MILMKANQKLLKEKHLLSRKRLIFILLIVLYMEIGMFLARIFQSLWNLLRMKMVKILLK
nr:MAG TPA: hypothetical protein [Caudoviricetes sp.]